MPSSYNIGLIKETFYFDAADCSFNLLWIVMLQLMLGAYYISKITKAHCEQNYTAACKMLLLLVKMMLMQWKKG